MGAARREHRRRSSPLPKTAPSAPGAHERPLAGDASSCWPWPLIADGDSGSLQEQGLSPCSPSEQPPRALQCRGHPKPCRWALCPKVTPLPAPQKVDGHPHGASRAQRLWPKDTSAKADGPCHEWMARGAAVSPSPFPGRDPTPTPHCHGYGTPTHSPLRWWVPAADLSLAPMAGSSGPPPPLHPSSQATHPLSHAGSPSPPPAPHSPPRW